MVKTKYWNLYPSSYKVSPHFRLRELKCKGTYKVKYDTDCLAMLEKVRAHFGGPTDINSAYRTPAVNAAVGGASNSAHLYGQGYDFIQWDENGRLVPAKEVCLFIERSGWAYGIGMMKNSTHMDNRFENSRLDETRTDPTYGGHYKIHKHEGSFVRYFGYKGAFPTATVNTSRGSIENTKRAQRFLNWYGIVTKVDGKFGPQTEENTKVFQRKVGLKADGSWGPITRAKAKDVTK